MANSATRRALLRAAVAGAFMPALSRGADEPAPHALRTELLRTGLFLVSGGGANTLVRLTPKGLLLVDAKRDESFQPLMAQVRRLNRLADLPLRMLVLTSEEDSHAGGAPRLRAAGAVVLAPSRSAGRREVELGGARVTLLDLGPARGPADAVAHFPDLQVTAIGRLYEPGEPRTLLLEGGSLCGWAAALDEVLRLEAGLVVPAQGPPVGRAELQALRGQLPSAGCASQ